MLQLPLALTEVELKPLGVGGDPRQTAALDVTHEGRESYAVCFCQSGFGQESIECGIFMRWHRSRVAPASGQAAGTQDAQHDKGPTGAGYGSCDDLEHGLGIRCCCALTVQAILDPYGTVS